MHERPTKNDPTLILKALSSNPKLFSALIVKLETTLETKSETPVGVPETTPVEEFKEIPEGSEPETTENESALFACKVVV
jgi:hypothetical protein